MKRNLFPQVTIYSSKLLFDNNEDRMKKRTAQMLRRKNVFSHNKNFKIEKTNESSSEQIITPSTQDYTIQSNLKINFDENNDINEISDTEFNDKEINLSDISDLHDSNNKLSEDKNSYAYKNKFALEYLSSHLDSFISLKNKLKSKINYENNNFTESYSLALFNSQICESPRNKYEVDEIIPEEKESCTPKRISIKNSNKKIIKNKKILHLNNFMKNLGVKNSEDNSHILSNYKRKNTSKVKLIKKSKLCEKNIQNVFRDNLKKIFIKIPLLKLLKLEEFSISKYKSQYKLYSSKTKYNFEHSEIISNLNNSNAPTKKQTNNKNICSFNKKGNVALKKKSVVDYLILLKNKYKNNKSSKLIFDFQKFLK